MVPHNYPAINQNSRIVPKNTHCLIEVCSDGFLKAYGPRNLFVTMVNRPKVGTASAGCILDQLLHEILPQPYREIYYPSAIRATGQVKRITIDLLLGLMHDLVFLNRLNNHELDNKQLLRQILGASR